ncbi:MAG: DUF2232 domain-containing protein [Clostridiales bacterium]|nr:DUF2232 domain-containing protein [Clostridiales bacterium]
MSNILNDSNKTDINPWIDRTQLPKLSIVSAISLSIAAVVFSLWTTFGFYDITAFAYLIISCSSAATVLILTRSPLVILMPITSYGLALLLSRSLVDSIASLLYFPAAAVIALCIYRFKSRNSTVCAASLTLALTFAIFFSIAIYKEYGSLDITTLEKLWQTIKDETRTFLESARRIDENGQSVRLYSDELISTMFSLFLNLSPAIIIFIFNALSFAAVKIVQLLFHVFKVSQMLPSQNWKFSISAAGAIIYLAAYVASLIFTADNISVLWAVVANIVYILTPGLFLVGINRLSAIVKQKKMYFDSIIIIFVIIMALLFMNSLFITALSFLGAFHSIKDSGIIRFPSKKA